jgi:ATP-dependent exoDNAse (exonuclease V) beta subunit
MLKVTPALEVNQELTSVDKGTLMHQALEIIYQPYMSKRMIAEYYDEMLKNLSGILERIFSFKIKSTKTKTGKNALLFNIIEEIIKRFLIAEKHQVSVGNKIQILSLEYKFSKSIYIKTLNKKINFKGTVDRIDIFNDELRIIDYKTGNINESDLSFSSWEELRMKTKKSALFQLVFYVYILKDDFKKKNFIAGVIPLKTFKNNFLAVSQKESLRTKKILKMEAQVLSHFENELFELVREIYDPSVPFIDLT